MARNGSFDPHLEPRAWWDEQALVEGWFDADLIGASSGPRIYAVIYASSLAEPSAAQIKAGQNVNSSAATWAGSIAAPTSTQTVDFDLATGLTAGTSYKVSFVWSDGTLDSEPETSSAFSTTGGGAFEIDAAAGSYGATGAAADLLADRALEADGGTYAQTGAAADLLAQRAIDAEAGAYTATGAAADLLAARALDAEAGSYTLTGADADLVGPQTGFTLDAEAGTYGATGAAADLLAARALSADAGAYAATGSDADLLAGRALEAAAGSYAATGAAADLLAGRALDAEAGAYALTGANAELGIAGLYLLDAEAGSYATTGADADLEPPARAVERSSGGGGGRRPRRPIVVRIDDEEFIVETPAEAQQLIAQAETLAETAARAKAQELAARSAVRMRAARRAAPVVRIESPEPAPEIEAIREQVDAVNARIQALYVQALQTALIAREMQRRIEEDEEDAITALLA